MLNTQNLLEKHCRKRSLGWQKQFSCNIKTHWKKRIFWH